MAILSLIIGILLIGIGFLVKTAPDMIAGYNSLPKEKKENIDILGLSSFIRNVLIITGLSVIIGYNLFSILGLSIIGSIVIFISVFGGITVIIMNSNKFDHNKQKTKSKIIYFVWGLIILMTIGLFYYGTIPVKIIFEGDLIHITGMYGIEFPKSDIKNVSMTENIPSIIKRSNGFSFGSINKGNYTLEKFGKCRLFLQSVNGPYLMITKTNNEIILINFKNKIETEQYYHKLNLLNNN